MRIAKFEGANMREALAKVKRELGDDAVVVATREIRRGLLGNAIEVSAAIDVDPKGQGQGSGPSTGGPLGLRNPALSEDDLERAIGPLRSELRSLRSLLRATASEARPGAELRDELKELRRALESLRSGGAAPAAAATKPGANAASAPVAAAPAAAPLAELARAHRIAAPSQARIVALIGPTGVGKTTTIAKLAARAALVDGRSVAIVSLDSYRVGGAQQMAIFADLMGVPLHCVAHPDELAACLAELGEHDLILIDTAGRSPRDHRAIEELARAFAAIDDLEVHLAIAAATAPATIDELRERYRILSPSRLLFTKLDEANGLEQLVRAPARLAMSIAWITTGQAVPEDLEDASAPRLLELARRGADGLAPPTVARARGQGAAAVSA